MSELLSAKNISKYYSTDSGRFYALKNASVSFPQAGLFAIEGKSGSGKSTLLHLLSSLLRPDSGKIYFKGKRIDKWSELELSQYRNQSIGMVFQSSNLLVGLTALENVMMPLLMQGVSPSKAKRSALDMLSKVGLSHHSSKDVGLLSGGERQRVSICRCLIKEPEVVFADEPTGALDEANTKIAMDMLKEYAKEHLVLLVSHNHEVVLSYADAIFRMEDGQLFSFEDPSFSASLSRFQKKAKYGGAWRKLVLKKNVKDNRFMNALCFVSSMIGFASLICCVGYFHGYPLALEEEKKMSLEYGTGYYSQKTYIEIPNSPLNLIQQKKPRWEKAKSSFSENVFVGNDYSYFFPNVLGFRLEDEKELPCTFSPVYSFQNPLIESATLLQGELPLEDDLAYCLVNDCFLQEHPDSLGKTIRVEYQTKIQQEGTVDAVDLDLDLCISGVVKEFSFLNTPKVYYSYLGLQNYFEAMILPEVSLKKGENVTLSSSLFLLPGDSPYGCYHWSLFAKNELGAIEIEDATVSVIGDYEVTSNAIMVASTFQDLSSALASCLVIFVVIAFVCLILIIGMSSFSAFLSKKKEVAIIVSFGAKQKDVFSIFAFEKAIVSFIAALAGIFASPLLANVLNRVLSSQFQMNEIIRLPLSYEYSVPFLLPLIALLSGPIIAYLATLLPLKKLGKVDVSEVLKDE